MKAIFIILLGTIIGCKSSKESSSKESIPTTLVNKLAQNSNQNDSLTKTPSCIKELINTMKAELVTNPPSKIFSYLLEGKLVYYVPPICCDYFSDLYNDSCKIIAHPDGGFTGRGDGKLPDFHKMKQNEKLIWEDNRK
jgi:hypothetical protein